jgi:invasion protein IalB
MLAFSGNKQSQMGCLDQIYISVEDLSSDYFQTKAYKGMLLVPLNATSSHSSQLKINIDDSDTKKGAVYICRGKTCSALLVVIAGLAPFLMTQYGGDRPENNHGDLAPARLASSLSSLVIS